jgi:flavin reductase (DIM6/NTAB) family NADH-FMN oxidoreductase RutF
MTAVVDDARDASERVLAASALEPTESLSTDEFKNAFRNLPAGVSLITADDGTRSAALTATSVASISADPPLLLFSLSGLSSATPVICNSETVVVHLLTADELHLAKLGSTSGVDRFADTTLWTRLPTGEPVFHEAKTWIRGRVLNLLQAGNSTIVLVHALALGTKVGHEFDGETCECEPLVYHNRVWHGLCQASRVE